MIIQIKTEGKGNSPYTETLNTHKLSRLCVNNTFTYEDVFDPMKMKDGKGCVEKLVQDNGEDKVLQHNISTATDGRVAY